MKKALVLLTAAFAFAGTVGCASAPKEEIQPDEAPVAEASAAADVPQAEPMPEQAPIVSEPPAATSPSLGASSSGRGH